MPVFHSKKYKLPNGEEVTLYPINVLAEELGRTPQCIRQWEISGILPKPLFRINGIRLYTKEQIDIIYDCACRAKLRKGKCIAKTSFSEMCHTELAKLAEKYISKKEVVNNAEVEEK